MRSKDKTFVYTWYYGSSIRRLEKAYKSKNKRVTARKCKENFLKLMKEFPYAR